MQTITQTPALTNVVYYETDPAITRTPTYSLTPSDCPNELTLSVTQSDNSALPSSISYSAGTITVYASTYFAMINYTVKVVATDPKTSI